MQSLKTYLLEGLIQAALLLSLCGVRVQVGVEEPDGGLPELGPTSALLPPAMHAHLHNLRNTLEDGLHRPKSPDLDQFFTARRLLGFVRSLDRLQVPQTELETWLVQQDPAPLPVRLLQGAPDRLILPQQTRETARVQEQGWEGIAEEWEEPMEEPGHNHTQVDSRHAETADRGMPPSLDTEDRGEGDTGERGHTEEDQSSASLQECLRLLESFPLRHEQQEQVCNSGPPRLESPLAVAQGPPSDVEQHWQDLMDLMDPQSLDMDLLTRLEQAPQVEQGGPLMDGYLQHDSPQPSRPRSDLELLPLVPSDQLDDSTMPTPRRLSAPLPEDLPPPPFLLDEGELEELLEDAALMEDLGLLEDEEAEEREEGDFGVEMTHRLVQEGYLDPELTRRTSRLSLSGGRRAEEWSEEESGADGHTSAPDVADELDSDSGLSLDSSHCPPSPSDSESSSYSLTSCSSSSSAAPSRLPAGPSPMELEVTIKEEPLDDDDEEEQLGAVGGHSLYSHQDSKQVFSSPFYADQKLYDGFPWLHQVTHDHTYNQPSSQLSPKSSSRPLKPSPRHGRKPYAIGKRFQSRDERQWSRDERQWGRDERRARALKIPFSNEVIVNLPVEEFNDLLANFRLNAEQLNLVRDIRRRGKNKIAAQNCRKRKMDTMAGLEKDVTALRRRRTKLLREKQDALRTLQELKQRMSRLYQDVFSRLRDGEGRPLDVNEYTLSFESDGGVDVVSRRGSGKERSRRRPKDKK